MKIDDIKNGDTLSLDQFREMGLHTHIGSRKQKRCKPSELSEMLGNDSNIGGDKKSTKRNSKFNAIKTTVDGIVFDSKFEAHRYSILKLQERAGEIINLQLQVPYPIDVNGERICKYVADFVYEVNGEVVIEDAKGVRTPEYRLKKKLMKAVFGVDIRETYRNQGANK